MKILWFKRRDYPIKRDEYGRSVRRQAFDLFAEGYRPSQISKEGLVVASMKTLLRYFEDWKKKKHRASRSVLRKIMKNNPEFTEKYVQMLADYFEVSTEDIVLRLQKPWGIMRLTKGELPDIRLERSRSEAEERLEGALRLMFLTEKIFRNSPKQIGRFIFEILALQDNTAITVSKVEGQIMIRKEKLQEIS